MTFSSQRLTDEDFRVKFRKYIIASIIIDVQRANMPYATLDAISKAKSSLRISASPQPSSIRRCSLQNLLIL